MRKTNTEPYELKLDWWEDNLRCQQLSESGRQTDHKVSVILDPNEGSLIAAATSVRVLGAARNASLICRLMDSCKPGRFDAKRLLIGSPAVCHESQLSKPDQLWLKFDDLANLPPSVGGWHPASEADYWMYDLVRQFEAAAIAGRFKRSCQTALTRHPVWPALSFVAGLNRWAAACLLTTIVDPRWYVDPRNPSRLSRLRSYLGLTPRNFEILAQRFDNPRPALSKRTRYLDRAENVLRSWSTTVAGNDYNRLFLRAVSADSANRAKGELRASALFINFVVANWLQALSPTIELFVPEYFFASAETAAAFRKYMQRRKR